MALGFLSVKRSAWLRWAHTLPRACDIATHCILPHVRTWQRSHHCDPGPGLCQRRAPGLPCTGTWDLVRGISPGTALGACYFHQSCVGIHQVGEGRKGDQKLVWFCGHTWLQPSFVSHGRGAGRQAGDRYMFQFQETILRKTSQEPHGTHPWPNCTKEASRHLQDHTSFATRFMHGWGPPLSWLSCGGSPYPLLGSACCFSLK